MRRHVTPLSIKEWFRLEPGTTSGKTSDRDTDVMKEIDKTLHSEGPVSCIVPLSIVRKDQPGLLLLYKTKIRSST